MKRNQTDLTHGVLWKQILIFSVPLIFSNLLQVLFNMADLAVVGQFVGSRALGAVGSTTILVTLFTGIVMGMASGVNVLAARHLGSGDRHALEKTVHTSALLCLMTGILIAGVFIPLTRPILLLMGTKEELIDGAVLYLQIYLAGMPALSLYNFGNAVFSAGGDTRRPLLYLSLAGALNVALNLFFVLVCNMAVAGVAVASILSQYISAFLILAALFRTREPYRMHLKCLRMDRRIAGEVCAIGIPSALQNAIFQLANLFVQSGVNSFSATLVEGNSAATNADPLVYDVIAAFYTACSSFIGQNYGAGDEKRIRKTYLLCTFYAFGAAVVLCLPLIFCGRAFLGLFTTDEEVIEMGLLRLRIMAKSYAFSAFMDNTIAASRGLGKSVVPMVIVFLGSCVFRILWINTIFRYFHTIPSLYLLYICSWSVTAAVEIVYYRKISRLVFRQLRQRTG